MILVDSLSEDCLQLVQDGLVRAASKVALQGPDRLSANRLCLCQGAHSSGIVKELQLEVYISSSVLRLLQADKHLFRAAELPICALKQAENSTAGADEARKFRFASLHAGLSEAEACHASKSDQQHRAPRLGTLI